jgi:hypothetical protein
MGFIGITIASVIISTIFFSSRRWALIAVCAGILFLSQNEQVEIFNINIFYFRFIEVAGFIRVAIRSEYKISHINKIDKIFIVFIGYNLVVFLLRTNESVYYQVGVTFDAFLSYIFFRGIISNIDDFKWFLDKLVLLLVPFFAFVLIEKYTLSNPFQIVGASAVSENFRDGIPRCAGSFRHAILLGSFGATLLPLYIGKFFSSNKNFASILGITVSLGIIWLSNSGGPLSSSIICFVGWSFWFMREKLAFLRKMLFIGLIFLAVFMNAPIWYLPAKIAAYTGGSGWHRSYLIDIAIKNISEWWLIGMPIEKTASWFPYIIHTGGADITNEFLVYGITSGLISIMLFIYLIASLFRVLGSDLSAQLREVKCNSDKYLIWGLGVMLLVHISNWFGVSYFDQMKYVWYLNIATISSIMKSIES